MTTKVVLDCWAVRRVGRGDSLRVLVRCFVCRAEFEFAPRVFAGKLNMRGCGVTVCDACCKVSWEGWNPHAEELLVRHLRNKGVDVPGRNAAGLLPREFDLPLGSRREPA